MRAKSLIILNTSKMSTEETGLEIKAGKSLDDSTVTQPTTEEVATTSEVRTEEQPETDNKTVSQETVLESQRARELGVTNRSMAESLIEMARISDVNKAAVKSRIEGDTVLKRYFEKKFPEALALISNDKELTGKSEEQVRVEVKAEMLKQSLDAEKQVSWEDFSVKLGLNGSEAAELKALAEKLEGTTVKGKEVTWKDALALASTTVNADKAKAGKVALPSGAIQEPAKPTKKSMISDEMVSFQAQELGRDPEEVKASFQALEKGMKGNAFTFNI